MIQYQATLGFGTYVVRCDTCQGALAFAATHNSAIAAQEYNYCDNFHCPEYRLF